MSDDNLGNVAYRLVAAAKTALFTQGEIAQLTYGAFDSAVTTLRDSDLEEVTFQFPIGYKADRTSMLGDRTYQKAQLLERYRYLAQNQLGLNGIVQLVTIIDACFGDILRAVVRKYPKKLGAKRTMSLGSVLEAASIEEVHMRATDALLNELAYKSPAEYAEAVKTLIGVNLLECPAFHKYVEIKATRDIYIHNRGVANDVYLRKAGTHARVGSGHLLPVDDVYFLESYESCLQITEWLERDLHTRWHSSEYEQNQIKLKRSSAPMTGTSGPQAIEQATIQATEG